MVVPAKVAAQVGKGLVKPMKSKAVAGGVHGTLVDGAKVIVANASFVPVQSATAGAATGTAVGTVAAGSAITVAAPLVLLAVAVGASAYADNQRQKAIEHITELLEQLHDDNLERERNELDGCRDAIDKATGLLLDRGKVGASLGLDSAVHAISTAIQNADRRVKKWEAALGSLVGNRVEVSELEAAFPGVSEHGGTFRTHLELAALAIALKRRVIVLQGVEAGQSDPDNQFENFVRSLKGDQQRILDLEARIDNVLRRLSESGGAAATAAERQGHDPKAGGQPARDVVSAQGPRRGGGRRLRRTRRSSSRSRSTATARSWCFQPARPDLLWQEHLAPGRVRFRVRTEAVGKRG